MEIKITAMLNKSDKGKNKIRNRFIKKSVRIKQLKKSSDQNEIEIKKVKIALILCKWVPKSKEDKEGTKNTRKTKMFDMNRYTRISRLGFGRKNDMI